MDATDQELLQRFQKERCEQAFSDLVARHAPMVIATARRILRDQHQAEDVAQSVFIHLARKAGQLSRDHSIAGWLYLEARHRSLDFLRSDTRRTVRENSVAMQTTEPNPSGLIDDLESVLGELPAAERDVLVRTAPKER